MADPFSVAASVAGILSLGIESCKLIVKYCGDIRGADDQVDSIALKAGGLLSTLQQIDTLLKETDGIHPKIADDIREKVLQNETWITRINERVARLSITTSSNGLSDKLRATAKKAAYPSKKNSILDTVEILQGLQMNLHTALLTLQIQYASALSKQTELIERVESLLLVRTGQLGLDMGRMELAIRNSSTSHQHPASVVRETHGTSERRESRMPCVCSNEVVPFANEMAIRRTCRRHKHSMRTTTRTKKLTFANSWFAFYIEAAISISRRANGFSITPTLHYHPIVPYDSPAFNLVWSEPKWNATPEEIARHHSWIIQELERLFDQGGASPFDRTAEGSTLLHVASFQYSYHNPNGIQQWNVIKYLVDAGCPIHEADVHGRLAIDHLLRYPGEPQSLATRFLTLGAVFMDSIMKSLYHGKIVEHLWSHNREAFFVSDVNEAILSYSEDMLKCHLELAGGNQQKIIELYYLCLWWADGIRILHEAGGKVPTSEKNELLWTAVLYDRTDAAQALVDIGAVAKSSLVALSKSEQMDDILIQDLISKGEHILMLAKTALPPHVQIMLGLQDGHLPDMDGENIVLELENRGLSIDPLFRYYNMQPVFCAEGLRADQMERLYQAGFRDLDAPDDRGYTPLMQSPKTYPYSWDTVERARWLVNKGANLDTICETSGKSARDIVILNIVTAMIHCLMSNFDLSEITYNTKFDGICPLLPTDSTFLQQLLGPNNTNESRCFCSVSNGSFLSTALHFATNVASRAGFGGGPVDRASLSILFEALMTGMQIRRQTANDIIRFLSFTDLELTHTCYHEFPVLVPFDKEDAVEIHDEERHLIEELESLVVELQREYETLGLPLWEYIQAHWCDRMSDYLEQHGETVTDTSMCSILRPRVLDT